MATHFPYPLAWSVCVSARASFREELPRLTAGQAGPRYGVRAENVSTALSGCVTPGRCHDLSGFPFLQLLTSDFINTITDHCED